jgi:hypothetical protein
MYAITQTEFSPVKTLYTDTDIKEYFRALTGFQPRQFQTETIHKILNRQDVLLRAPTGSGKIETARDAFLFCVSGMDLFGGRFGNSLRVKFSIARIGKIVRYKQLFWQAGLLFSVFARSNSNHSGTPVVAEFEL